LVVHRELLVELLSNTIQLSCGEVIGFESIGLLSLYISSTLFQSI
jgi:hypothetical protein